MSGASTSRKLVHFVAQQNGSPRKSTKIEECGCDEHSMRLTHVVPTIYRQISPHTNDAARNPLGEFTHDCMLETGEIPFKHPSPLAVRRHDAKLPSYPTATTEQIK